MEAYQITSPFHPTLATTLDLIKTLRSLDPSNPDPAISKLAKAVYPEIGDGVWKTVIVSDDRFDLEEPFRGVTRAKFNNGVVTVHHGYFTDFFFKGPWFEVRVIQRDYERFRAFTGPYGDEDWYFDIEIVRGKDTRRYLDWAKRTGTILKLFGER